TDAQIGVVEQLSHIGMRNHELPISKEQADTFFSEALPLLKKAGPVKIDENVSEEMIDKPLKATLHLELKANWIIGKLNYYYGNYEINPFSRLENKEVVIIRDVDKERQIMSLIEQAHFHYNGKELYLECSEDEDMYNFLYTIIPVLEDKLELYLTSDVMNLI